MVTTDEDDEEEEGYDEGKGDKTMAGGGRRKMKVYKAIFPGCEKQVRGGVGSRVWRCENIYVPVPCLSKCGKQLSGGVKCSAFEVWEAAV